MATDKEIGAAAQASMETCVKFYSSQFTFSKDALRDIHTAIAKAVLKAAEEIRNG